MWSQFPLLWQEPHLCSVCLHQSLATSLAPQLLLPVPQFPSLYVPHRVLEDMKVVSAWCMKLGLAAGAPAWILH